MPIAALVRTLLILFSMPSVCFTAFSLIDSDTLLLSFLVFYVGVIIYWMILEIEEVSREDAVQDLIEAAKNAIVAYNKSDKRFMKKLTSLRQQVVDQAEIWREQ